MSLAKLIKLTYDNDEYTDKIVWGFYYKTNASISKKVRLLNELLNINNLWFQLRFMNFFNDQRRECIRLITRKRGRKI